MPGFALVPVTTGNPDKPLTQEHKVHREKEDSDIYIFSAVFCAVCGAQGLQKELVLCCDLQENGS